MDLEQEKPGFYAIIPADVRYDEHIPPNAKLLYAEISALIGKEGFCYASNEYFNKTFGFSEPTVARLIGKLEEYGYVKRVIARDDRGHVTMRKIYLKTSMPEIHPPLNFETTTSQNREVEGLKNDRYTNLTITNIEKENKKEKSTSTATRTAMDDEQLLKACIDWINSVEQEWSRDEKNALYLALTGFYAPREDKKHTPSRTPAAFTALTNRLIRYSVGDLTVMVDMLERAVTAGWKSVYPLRDGSAPEPSVQREDEIWL